MSYLLIMFFFSSKLVNYVSTFVRPMSEKNFLFDISQVWQTLFAPLLFFLFLTTYLPSDEVHLSIEEWNRRCSDTILTDFLSLERGALNYSWLNEEIRGSYQYYQTSDVIIYLCRQTQQLIVISGDITYSNCSSGGTE